MRQAVGERLLKLESFVSQQYIKCSIEFQADQFEEHEIGYWFPF